MPILRNSTAVQAEINAFKVQINESFFMDMRGIEVILINFSAYNKCLFVGNFGILSVVIVYNLHQLMKRLEIFN